MMDQFCSSDSPGGVFKKIIITLMKMGGMDLDLLRQPSESYQVGRSSRCSPAVFERSPNAHHHDRVAMAVLRPSGHQSNLK